MLVKVFWQVPALTPLLVPVGLNLLDVQNLLVVQRGDLSAVPALMFECGKALCIFTGLVLDVAVPTAADDLDVMWAFRIRDETILGPDTGQDVGRAAEVVPHALEAPAFGHGRVQQNLAVVLAAGQRPLLVVRLALAQLAHLERVLVGLRLELLHERGPLHLGQRHERLQVAVLGLGWLVAGLLLQLGHVLSTSALGAGDLLHELVDG